jgi:peptidoglycan/LPS O-acetylase OafA/YrhL
MERPGSRRYLLLDHWRGLACLSVLVFHASGQQPEHGTLAQEVIARLWIGVPVFFVISGYCITASVIRTRDSGGTLTDYFKRRLRRIFPPYWAAMLLVAFVASVAAVTTGAAVLAHTRDGFDAIDAHSLSAWRWLGTLTLTEGWRGHLLPFGGRGWFLGHAWTLGYEEQFYAVAGLMLLLAPRRWFAWSMLRPEFGSNGIVTETAVGAATALLLIPLYRYDTSFAALAILKPLQWCGLRCYSLYLLHWPVAKIVWWGLTTEGIDAWPRTQIVSVPLTLVLSVAVTAVFFKYVERPCLSSSSRRAVARVETSAPPARPGPVPA